MLSFSPFITLKNFALWARKVATGTTLTADKVKKIVQLQSEI